MDWSYSESGHKWSNGKYFKIPKGMKEGEILSVEVDRIKGTVGFSVHGMPSETFQDEENKTGELHFACCSGYAGNAFVIL